MYYNWPKSPEKQRPLIERFFRENIGTAQEMLAQRRRPMPVRDLVIIPGAGQVNISWLGPQNMAGITGFNVYRGNETNLILNVMSQQFPRSVAAPGQRYQANVTGLDAGIPVGFFISCYTALLESIKSRVLSTPT